MDSTHHGSPILIVLPTTSCDIFLQFIDCVVHYIRLHACRLSINAFGEHIPGGTGTLVRGYLLASLLGRHVASILEQILPAALVFCSQLLIIPQQLVLLDCQPLVLLLYFILHVYQVVSLQLPLSPLLLVLKQHCGYSVFSLLCLLLIL